MSNETTGEPVTVSGQLLLAYLAGRVTPLNFARQFGWADELESATNPFRDRARDGFKITNVEVSGDNYYTAQVTFHFAPAGDDEPPDHPT